MLGEGRGILTHKLYYDPPRRVTLRVYPLPPCMRVFPYLSIFLVGE